MPTACPHCGTVMVLLGSGVVEDFDPTDPQSPKFNYYYCGSNLTQFCHGRYS